MINKFDMIVEAIKEKYSDKETRDKLIEYLYDNECWICALEAAGVDNWEGYDFAREIYEKYKKGEE
jgi:hypothetical protein